MMVRHTGSYDASFRGGYQVLTGFVVAATGAAVGLAAGADVRCGEVNAWWG